jgi:hypothetical protein
VAIDTSGKWWRGDSPTDIEEYLRAYTSDTYPIVHYRACVCSCGSVEFGMEKDSADQARRNCARCGARHYIADAEEYWEPGRPKKWKCIECRGTVCNIGVGFAGYDDDPTGIKWLYTGERCIACGILGSFADWKVALSNALRLLEKV